jgi:GABA permease
MEQQQNEPQQESGLQRSLKRRHMTMIALGGVIGAGLFVGSREVISSAGPAAVVSFLITGILVILIMRMLGEMAVAQPTVGSFYEYSRLALGGLAGFLTGWMYWYFWLIVIAVEVVAGGELLQYWLPEVPSWVFTLALMVTFTITNLLSVRSYGEFEFWFASIKVAAIVVFLFLGTLYVLGLWPDASLSFANLTTHGGFAPNGITAVLTGAVAATGFYFGAEIVSVAAAESAEPERAVARATNSVITRVLIFYLGSIFLVVTILPWNESEEVASSPFVGVLDIIGIPAAAQIMNAVILTAVLSSLNSGLYASSRMLFALTKRGDAPKGLAKLSRRGVPVRAILLGTVFGYASVVMSYVSPGTVFAFLINSYGTVALVVYLLIAITEWRMRRRLEREAPEQLRLRMWGYPYLTYLAILGMLVMIFSQALIPEKQSQLALGLVSISLILLAYVARSRWGSKETESATVPAEDHGQEEP